MKGEEGGTGRSGGKGKATVIRIHCMTKALFLIKRGEKRKEKQRETLGRKCKKGWRCGQFGPTGVSEWDCHSTSQCSPYFL